MPPLEVSERVERRVADAEEDPEFRWAGIEALAQWALPSSAAVFRQVLAREEDDYLHGPAIRGLGLTGEPTDVPALIAAAAAEPEPAIEALSLLAGRAFESVREFETWRKTREDGSTWVRDALRAESAGLDRLDAPAAAPLLVDLLVHPSLPIRWNAFRALRAKTGKSLGLREVLSRGRFNSPESPDLPLDLSHVLGDGWTVSYRGVPGFDMDALGAALQPVRDRDGAIRWERAAARWRAALERR